MNQFRPKNKKKRKCKNRWLLEREQTALLPPLAFRCNAFILQETPRSQFPILIDIPIKEISRTGKDVGAWGQRSCCELRLKWDAIQNKNITRWMEEFWEGGECTKKLLQDDPKIFWKYFRINPPKEPKK